MKFQHNYPDDPVMVSLTTQDVRAFAVLAELASHCPLHLQNIADYHDVKPEWMVGLLNKMEDCHDRLDDQSSHGS